MTPDETLRVQLEDDWKYWMAQYPEFATIAGYPGENARWTDYSQAASMPERHTSDKVSSALHRSTAAASLPAISSTTTCIATCCRPRWTGCSFHNDAIPFRGVIPHNLMMPVNQLEGIQQDIPRVIGAMPAVTAADYEKIVSRLERIAPLVDQTIALMERGLAAGMTPPSIAVRDLPGQVAGQIVADLETEPAALSVLAVAGNGSRGDRAALAARATSAYESSHVRHSRSCTTFWSSAIFRRAGNRPTRNRCRTALELYAYNVRWHTTTSLTPQQIHDTGQAEVKRIRGEMDKVISSSGFAGSYQDFVKFLRTDPRFYFTDAPSLLSAYRDIAKRADPELARLFGRLPQTPYGVRAIPDAIAPSQTTAYYDQGALNAGRPAYMYANTYKLEARPKWEMEALTMHEAVPGHHLQIALAQELDGLPEFRKNSSFTAFVEGWALYSESLGEEMGFYEDPYSRFGQLTYEMWRAVRLVVDTGLHSMGWTRQQAIDFFTANAAKTEQDIIVEVDRYIVWPGQALGYKIGQLKISELRARATRELGRTLRHPEVS